jgi:hypothetical protein
MEIRRPFAAGAAAALAWISLAAAAAAAPAPQNCTPAGARVRCIVAFGALNVTLLQDPDGEAAALDIDAPDADAGGRPLWTAIGLVLERAVPNATTDEQVTFFKLLMVRSMRGETAAIPFGRYDWTMAWPDRPKTHFIVHAVRKR